MDPIPKVMLVALGGLVGCTQVQGSAVPTNASFAQPTAGQVRLVTLDVPPSAVQVGLIQAKGTGTLERLAVEYAAQARRVGGNLAKVDRVTTKFEIVPQAQSYSYQCGTGTCSGTHVVMVEVATTQLVGRAYRWESP
jgi:hypothetical protein